MGGLIPPTSVAKAAFAWIKSIFARNSYDSSRSGRNGRSQLVKSVSILMISRRSSASSSRIRLLASTTSDGSIKTVLPEADSSCTIPLIFRLWEGFTGITSRPSRILGDTSLSTYPSACAFRRMAFRLLEMPFTVEVSSRRISDKRGDAWSFTCPKPSSMPSILLVISGKVNTSPANASRYGYLGVFSSSRRRKATIPLMVCSERRSSNNAFWSIHDPSMRIRFSIGRIS